MTKTKKSSNYINFGTFNRAKLNKEPFEYILVQDFIEKKVLDHVIKDFPKIVADGSFSLDSVKSGKHFLKFIDELKGDKFRKAVEKKFAIDLNGKPIMITARGKCKDANGKIHIDSKGKIITVLVYLNKNWDSEGGKLRLLNNEHDIEDYIAEVTPLAGSLVMFKCADNAWHGHKPFTGTRQSIQLNWVIDDSYLKKEKTRHIISALFKKAKKSLASLFS